MFERTLPIFSTLFVVLLTGLSLRAEDSGSSPLQPSFPNHAMLLAPPVVKSREPAGPVDSESPFSWNQTVVLREGSTSQRFLGGFDPDLQPVQFELQVKEPQFVNVDFTQGDVGYVQATALNNRAGTIEPFLFRVTSRGITNQEFYTLSYDLRDTNERVRGTPLLRRSAGDFVKPGHIVRYAWTQTGAGEKRPKVEAEFSGRTGVAKGISRGSLTAILSVKAQPFVLGHYLMTVTPRDVRGEPPRGSTSNGAVFRCAFGSENLAPVTDGMTADTFTPLVGQSITLRPVAFDPETGQSEFSNQTWDFGDGVVATGLTGATTHAYSTPGIYRVLCTMADPEGLTATAEDFVVVGATFITKFKFSFLKNVIPEEGGSGLTDEDKLAAEFKGAKARTGDRIVFLYNRNRFGRMNATDGPEEFNERADIVLKAGRTFSERTPNAKNITVTGGEANVSISLSKAQFNRTGDPRFGRSDPKGIFKNQRIAVCVIPADGSLPRVHAYTGNMTIKIAVGPLDRNGFFPEDTVKGSATEKEPNPKKQEIF